MATAVDADSVPPALQPITNVENTGVVIPVILDALGAAAKENQGIKALDTQLVVTDDGAASLSEVTKPPAEELVDIVAPDAKNLEDIPKTPNPVEIKDGELKKLDVEEVATIHVKDATTASNVSDTTTLVAANEVADTDIRKTDTEGDMQADAVRANASEETSTGPLSALTEVSPSAEESTPSVEPSISDVIEPEPASGPVVDGNPVAPSAVEVKVPVEEQEEIRVITNVLEEPSYANEEEITELAGTTPVKDDVAVEDPQAVPAAEEVDNGGAEKEAEGSKPAGIEDKDTGPELKEETATEIKANETEESNIESEAPEIDIQIEEAEDVTAEGMSEAINVSLPTVDDSLIAVEVVAPTPALVDNRELDESDVEGAHIPEESHKKATSMPDTVLEDAVTEGAETPRVEPEVGEMTEEKADVEEESIEDVSLEAVVSTSIEASPIKEGTTPAMVEAPAKAVEEIAVADEAIINQSIETVAEEESITVPQPEVEKPVTDSAPAVVEELPIPVQKEEILTKVEPVVEEAVVVADVSPMKEKLVADEAAITAEPEVESVIDAAPAPIPETQPAQEGIFSELPVTTPVQEKPAIDQVAVGTEPMTESIVDVTPITILEPQTAQGVPSDVSIATHEEQHVEAAVSHTATVDTVQIPRVPVVEESPKSDGKVEEAKAPHEPAPPAVEPDFTADFLPEPAAEKPVEVEAAVVEEQPIASVDVSAAREEKEGEADVKVETGTKEPAVEESVNEESVAEEVSVQKEPTPGPAKEKAITEEVSAREEPVVGEPVREEPVVEELPVKGEPIVEAMPIKEEAATEESVKEELIPEEVPVKEGPLAEGLPVKERAIVEEFGKEEPIVEEPVKEESAVEEPVKEEPIVGEPMKEESAVEEPVKDEPVIKGPVLEELVVEETIREETVREEPETEEAPGEQEHVAEENIIKELVKGGPVVEEPAEEGLVEEKLVAEDVPVMEEPNVEEPVVEPVKDEPIAEAPSTTGIVASEVSEKEEPVVEELARSESIVEEILANGEPATEEVSVTDEASTKEEPVVEEAPAKEEPVVEGAPAKEEPLAEEVPGKEDFVVEEPVKEEPVADEPAKAQSITEEMTAEEEPIAEEPVNEEFVAAKDEPVMEVLVKEEYVGEDVPTKKEAIVEEPMKEEPVVEEPVKDEPVVEAPVSEESDLVGPGAKKTTPDESAVQEVVEGSAVSAVAAEELMPVVEKTDMEDIVKNNVIEDTIEESIAAQPVKAPGIFVAQEIFIEEAVPASLQPVEDVEVLLAGEVAEAKAEIAEEAVVDIPIPVQEVEIFEESVVEKAMKEQNTVTTPVVEEPMAEPMSDAIKLAAQAPKPIIDHDAADAPQASAFDLIEEPVVQDMPDIDKADSNVPSPIPSAEPVHEPVYDPPTTIVESQVYGQVVADDPLDQEPIVPPEDAPVVPTADDSATREVNVTSNVNDGTLEGDLTEEPLAVAPVEPPLDELVFMAETSVADTTAETIMVPELTEDKKEEDVVPVVDISIADRAETLTPERFALSIPDDLTQVERLKSPWTPSFQVTTIGHGVSLPTEEDIPAQALDDVKVAEDAKPVQPEIVVDEGPTIEMSQPLAETDEPESAILTWTPSYSVHSQGSPSPSHVSLEQEAATHAEEEKPQTVPTSHEDVAEIQTPRSPDVGETVERPSAAETVEVVDEELVEAQVVLVTEDSPHEEQELEPAIPAPYVLEQHGVDPELEAQKLVQDENVPNETPTELPPQLEATQKPFIAEVVSLMPPLEQDRPASPSWVSSHSVSKQGSPSLERASLPDATSAKVITAEMLEESSTIENQSLQADAVSAPPNVIVNGSQPQDTQEEPAVEDRPSTPWAPSYSVTQQGGDMFEETQIGALVKEELTAEIEPRRSLSEEIEGSSAFSPTAFIGAGVFGSAAPFTASATLRKSTASQKSAESTTNTSVNGDTTPSESRQEKSLPALEIPDENRLHVSPLPPLDNNTLDTSSSLSADVSPISPRKRLESTTSSRRFPGGWFSNTSKIPDERTSLEVAQGVFTGAKQGLVEETLASPTVDPITPVREQSGSDKRRWCVIM